MQQMTDPTSSLMDSFNKFPLRDTDKPKQLVQATEEQAFWLHDGPALYNLHDLKHALDNITEEQFAYHVGDDKNDFAAWVRGVLKDEECANELMRCRTVLSTRRVLIKFLKEYE